MKKVFALTIAAIILIFSVVPVFAASDSSPTPTIEFNVIVHNTNGGTGSYDSDVDQDGKHIILVAHPKNGYKFSHWVIDGKYIIEDGSLTSKKLYILLESDVQATPYFVKEGKSSSGSKTSISSNPSPVSPTTGDNALYFAVLIAAVFAVLSGAVGVKLALSKSKK